MSKLQETLVRLDALMKHRAGKDEAIELIVKALHEIAADHHTLRSKVSGTPFSPSHTDEGLKGGVS